MGTKTIGRFVNTTPTAVGVNSNILFNNNTISTNCIAYTSNGIELRAPGVYMIYANFTVTSVAGGTATVNMLENGVPVAGASASETVGAVELRDLAFTGITTVRSDSGNNTPQYATLTFNNVNAMTYNVANVIVEKIA